MNFHRRQYTNTYFSIVTFCKENILIRLQCRVIDFGLVNFLFWNTILYLFECTHFECIYLKDYNLTFSLKCRNWTLCFKFISIKKPNQSKTKLYFRKHRLYIEWMKRINVYTFATILWANFEKKRNYQVYTIQIYVSRYLNIQWINVCAR